MPKFEREVFERIEKYIYAEHNLWIPNIYELFTGHLVDYFRPFSVSGVDNIVENLYFSNLFWSVDPDTEIEEFVAYIGISTVKNSNVPFCLTLGTNMSARLSTLPQHVYQEIAADSQEIHFTVINP